MNGKISQSAVALCIVHCNVRCTLCALYVLQIVQFYLCHSVLHCCSLHSALLHCCIVALLHCCSLHSALLHCCIVALLQFCIAVLLHVIELLNHGISQFACCIA